MHRGGLVESLATTVSVESLDDVEKFLHEKNTLTMRLPLNLTCKFYGYDDRISWETYIILDRFGDPVGFSDGMLYTDKELREIENPYEKINIAATCSYISHYQACLKRGDCEICKKMKLIKEITSFDEKTETDERSEGMDEYLYLVKAKVRWNHFDGLSGLLFVEMNVRAKDRKNSIEVFEEKIQSAMKVKLEDVHDIESERGRLSNK